MKCHAEKYCKKYPEGCNEYCIGYIQLRNIYALSGMPKAYQYDITLTPKDGDLDAYRKLRKYQDEIQELVQQGRGVFIYSEKRGNGKTTWATKLMNEYFKKVALNNNLRCRGRFINVPEFLEDLRRNMDNPTDEMVEVIDAIKNADMVIWDDIGAEKPSEWVRERLYTFINYRDANRLTQIYTSNLPLKMLAKENLLGDRIVDRIKGHAEQIRFIESSYRGEV